jgi:hypothetical protein
MKIYSTFLYAVFVLYCIFLLQLINDIYISEEYYGENVLHMATGIMEQQLDIFFHNFNTFHASVIPSAFLSMALIYKKNLLLSFKSLWTVILHTVNEDPAMVKFLLDAGVNYQVG